MNLFHLSGVPFPRLVLAGAVDAAQKPSEIPGEGNKDYADKFQRQTVAWQGLLRHSPGSVVQRRDGILRHL